jgi:hypothetical protein
MTIDLLGISVNQSNGALFASLVSQKHGARIGYWRNGTFVNYTTVTGKTIFTDTQVYNWGSGPSAIPEIGTFNEIVRPDMYVVFNSNYELKCDDPSYASMFVDPWPYANVHYYSVVKPPTPGIDFDWMVWLIGIEYVHGSPHLFGTVHYVWEP